MFNCRCAYMHICVSLWSGGEDYLRSSSLNMSPTCNWTKHKQRTIPTFTNVQYVLWVKSLVVLNERCHKSYSIHLCFHQQMFIVKMKILNLNIINVIFTSCLLSPQLTSVNNSVSIHGSTIMKITHTQIIINFQVFSKLT